MRRPSLLLGLAAAVLTILVGCAPAPKPIRTPAPSSSTSAEPSPTAEPAVEPAASFDVTCADVATALTGVIGEPSTPMQPVMSVVSTMNWIPGPAQYMFQRAGGIACSAGDADAFWEVTLVPGADAVIEGATGRQGYWGEQSGCGDGYCSFEFPDGDVLLSAIIHDPRLAAADTQPIEAVLRDLLGEASASVRDVEYGDSDIVGARCERFMTTAELAEQLGTEVEEFTDFGGWGIPAEVYNVVNGAAHCLYTSPGSGYEVYTYLQITTLPSGAWAFERQPGDAVVVDGADAAVMSTGERGERILDVRVGSDWIRFTTFDAGTGAADPVPIAVKSVRNFTVGHIAPQ